MIQKEDLSIIFFINIIVNEEYKTFNELKNHDIEKAIYWEKIYQDIKSKSIILYNDNSFTIDASYNKYAKFYPEFGKIISVTFAYMRNNLINNNMIWDVQFKTLVDNTNSEYDNIIIPSAKSLTVFNDSSKKIKLCGYKLTHFIFKYFVKKYIMYDVEIPKLLRFWEQKPWENQNIDLYNLLNVYTYNNTISYELALKSMNINIINIDWDNINIYYNEHNFDKIKMYNEEFVKSEIKLCHKISKSEIPLNI
ncbi:MAG TPA: hypothetical protein PKY44_00305 [Bacteroidales bacterium]|jgi:hypothetical protein|nr:hypothetical protein [Bacteroidales bacterium]